MNTTHLPKWTIAGALLSGAVAAVAFGLIALQPDADGPNQSSPTPLFRITTSPPPPSSSRP